MSDGSSKAIKHGIGCKIMFDKTYTAECDCGFVFIGVETSEVVANTLRHWADCGNTIRVRDNLVLHEKA